MKRIRNILVLLGFYLSYFAIGQERSPIEVYLPEEYGAENQNWAISQSKEKYIYVANNEGLLEFNGANWTLYGSPNETKIRSVNVVDSLIYTGCFREFGFWQKNEFGELTYSSLSQKLNVPFLEDEEIWNIIALEDWILFQSLKRIYIYNTKAKTFSIIESESTIYKIFSLNDAVYFQKAKDGIYKIENGAPELFLDHPVLKTNLLVNMFDYHGELLIETEDNGFYVTNGDTLNKWLVPANRLLQDLSVYRSIQLRDGSYMLGTISNGIIHITPEGEINNEINITNGLSNNTVLSVFEDMEQNIWLGLDNGINCVNVNSPYSVYRDRNGKLGTVYASAVVNGNMYLGTNQGLFYRPLGENVDFEFIMGTQSQVWCLVEFEDTLFCGHNSGTYVINNDKAELVSDIPGTWDIKPIGGRNDLLLQGNYDGLYVLERRDGNWKLKNKIMGFDNSSRFFEIFNDHEIFVNHEYKGVFKIKTDNNFTRALEISKDSSILIGKNSGLIKHNNNLLYSSKKGVFKYDSTNRRFSRDSMLSQLIESEEYISGKLIKDLDNNRLWGFSGKGLNFISPGKLSEAPEMKSISLPQTHRKGMIGSENINFLDEQNYLIGTTSGYMIVDLEKIQNKTYRIQINTITNGRAKGNPQTVNKSVSGVFPNNQRHLEFSFSVAEFNKFYNTEYQWQLEGMDEQWSTWSTESHVIYNYLPYGDYLFRVRARVGGKITNNVASYSFEIERPVALSNTMIAFYALVVLLFALIMHNTYKRYYKKQRDELLAKTTRELEVKELENKQQLMQFRNDNLRLDIESKNRELGISTMSLIKKNEFLGNLKKELKNVDDIRSLKHIIKIIDRNLNHTDDWNLFQEAFNNADKDFLKKIKSEHPNLTSNDLRLCAYLRLNLSSKEIAPLLNISSRSVEVKRYRLRKKMGLAHESSLTNYILEI